MSWNGVEKRRFVRANFPCKILVYTPQERTISTHTENIGAGGVRVLIEERMEISSIVGLEIYLAQEPIICKGKVVWMVEKKSCYRRDFIFYDTGIEFVDMKEEDRKVIKNCVEAIVATRDDFRED
jgi:c-di-GMP-binding flagellar brake protein YcgR